MSHRLEPVLPHRSQQLMDFIAGQYHRQRLIAPDLKLFPQLPVPPRDVYAEYGARIFGKKPERGPGDDQITDRLRSVAKVPTLGISYGLTPFGFVRQVQNELGINYEIHEAPGFSKRSLRCSLRLPLITPGRLKMPSASTVFALSAEPGAGFLHLWMTETATTGHHSNGVRRSSSTLPFRVRESRSRNLGGQSVHE
jgi:hypothetical protein